MSRPNTRMGARIAAIVLYIAKMKFRPRQPRSIAAQQEHLNSTGLFLLLNVWAGLLLYAAVQGWLLGPIAG